MATKTCPVCEHEQDNATLECGRCGWDFSPLLGTPEQAQQLLQERLDRSRAKWRQRGFDPERVPELERDPFETPEEFAVRLSQRAYYVGEAELRKEGYDIATGHFPLDIRVSRPWYKPWGDLGGCYHLRLRRDEARELYQRGAAWPLYARFAVTDRQVSLTRLSLVTPRGELRVEHPVVIGSGPMIGRYRDLGDGTVLDIVTGLQWMRCALGQSWDGTTCVGKAEKWDWKNLAARVEEFNQASRYGGHLDWRVPTIEELKSLIVENSDLSLCIDHAAFPNTPRRFFLFSCFWSSSPLAGSSNYAWYVDFGFGYVGNYGKDSQKYVRLVRGGQ